MGRGFVVVERNAGVGEEGVEKGQPVGQGRKVADGGYPSGEGLLCARDEVGAPFAAFSARPEVALGVTGLAFL